MRRVRQGYKQEFRLDSDDFGVIFAGVNNLGGYKRNV